ncbi:MAG: aspartate kinase [Ardenticatenaceae bacterium]|nr:aspartate kinase [Ardenticatenaceae bacterium]MCB9443589.1 aspartate kinase [Ardenticatenaceae bacterium]
MTLVMKFGGTSVGSAQAMRETAVLIQQAQQEWGQVVVVASGMGSKPVKVTDLLLNGAHTAVAGDGDTFKGYAEQMRQIHHEAIDGLLEPEGERQAIMAEIDQFVRQYERLCQAICVLAELTPRALDALGGMGEQMSVRILAAYLRQIGFPAEAVDATELVVTDDNFLSANPFMDLTEAKVTARLQPLLDQGITPIVTGFIGATKAGTTTTLGRGGSDFSAAILGQALKANEVWIWTDVDGVMTTDPRLVPSARNIPTLTFREVSELAFYGAKVLHPKTIRPCVENGIPLRIKNTFNPTHDGTVIVPDNGNGKGGIKAVTAIKNLSLLTVEGKGMLGVPGIAARTFGAVARSQVSVLLISQASSEQSICFATPEATADTVIAALEAEFATEIARRDIDRIWADHDVSIVTVVGAGMRGTPGIAGRLFSALGNNGVNIIAIAQGSSECSISLVVDGEETGTAVAHIHELI